MILAVYIWRIVLKGSEVWSKSVLCSAQQFVTKTEVLKWFWRKFQQIMSNDGENGEVQSQPNIFSDIYNYTKAPFAKVQIS